MVAIVATIGLGAGGCSYRRAYLAQPDYGQSVMVRLEPLGGESLGIVRAAEKGPVWKDCTDIAEASLWVLIEETRRRGGNAVGSVRWFPATQDRSPEEPACRQKWGWILIWPMLATPAFQVSRVEAVAYRVADPGAVQTDLIVIPDDVEGQRVAIARILDAAGAQR